jgi:endonuclease/exonuclease/phosphatase family metal-dependent hydrolase
MNFAVGFFFLLSCCNSFLHPDRWWMISLLAFFFPLLLVLLLSFLIFWLIAKSKYALVSVVCLIIGWQNIHAFFGFSFAKHDFTQKDSAGIRIMTWNVRRWDDFITKKTGASGHRLPMLDLVSRQNADILCFQEFYEPADSAKSNIRFITEHLRYPFFFFAPDYGIHKNRSENGVVIFSRYPIVSTSRERFRTDMMQKVESLISADILVNGKTIRIFTTHLQSVLFKPKDFRNVEIIRNAEDSILQASRSLAKKLKDAVGLRGYQADTVRNQLDKSPYPLVICGDFNDVPNSYTYFHIRGNLQDAFISRNFGIGRTYVRISPTLRIDYILPSRDFEVVQSRKLNSPYSDHHAVIADLRLQDRKR